MPRSPKVAGTVNEPGGGRAGLGVGAIVGHFKGGGKQEKGSVIVGVCKEHAGRMDKFIWLASKGPASRWDVHKGRFAEVARVDKVTMATEVCLLLSCFFVDLNKSLCVLHQEELSAALVAFEATKKEYVSGATKYAAEDDSDEQSVNTELTKSNGTRGRASRFQSKAQASLPAGAPAGAPPAAGGRGSDKKNNKTGRGTKGKGMKTTRVEQATPDQSSDAEELGRAMDVSKEQLVLDQLGREAVIADEKAQFGLAKAASVRQYAVEARTQAVALAKEEAANAAALREEKQEAKRARKDAKRLREAREREEQLVRDAEARRGAYSQGSTKRHKSNQDREQELERALEAERAKNQNLQLAAVLNKADMDADLQAERQHSAVFSAVMKERLRSTEIRLQDAQTRCQDAQTKLEDAELVAKLARETEATKRSNREFLQKLFN